MTKWHVNESKVVVFWAIFLLGSLSLTTGCQEIGADSGATLITGGMGSSSESTATNGGGGTPPASHPPTSTSPPGSSSGTGGGGSGGSAPAQGSSTGWDGSLTGVTLTDASANAITFNAPGTFYGMISSQMPYAIMVSIMSGALPKSDFTTAQKCSTGTGSTSCTNGDLSVDVTICASTSSTCTSILPAQSALPVTYDLSVAPNSAGAFPYPVSSISASICNSGTYASYMLDYGTFNSTTLKMAYNRSGTITVSKMSGVNGSLSMQLNKVLLVTSDKSKSILFSGTITNGDIIGNVPACTN